MGTDHVTNTVGWVYTLKHKTDGSLERARIVAKGFTQSYGIDYPETFAPLAKLNSIPYESFCQLQLTDLAHCIGFDVKFLHIVKVGEGTPSKQERGGPLVSRRLSEKEQVSASLCVLVCFFLFLMVRDGTTIFILLLA